MTAPAAAAPQRDPVAGALLGAVVLTVAVDWTKLDGAEGSRWLISLPLWLAPALWYLRDESFGRRVTTGSLRPLMALGLWAIVTVNWSPLQREGILLAAGLVLCTLASAHYVHRFGIEHWARVVSATLVIFLLAGSLAASALGVETIDGRWQGLARGPTDFAVAGLLVAVTGVIGWRTRPIPLVLVMAATVVAAAVSATRVPAAALLFGVSAMAFQRSRAGGRALLLVAWAVAMVGAAVIFAGADIGEVFERNPGEEEAITLTGRTSLWALVADPIAESPLIGSGYYAGPDVFGEFRQNGDMSWEATEAHNLWLQVTLELGIVGLVLCAWLFGSLVRWAVRGAHVAALGALAMLAITSITESLIATPTATLIVLAGLAAASTAPIAPRSPVFPEVEPSKVEPSEVEPSKVESERARSGTL